MSSFTIYCLSFPIHYSPTLSLDSSQICKQADIVMHGSWTSYVQKILNFVFFFKKVNTILEIAAKKSLFFFYFILETQYVDMLYIV